MKELSTTARVGAATSENRYFAVDTTFVLFFLAVEFGRITDRFGLDTVVFAVTLLMLTTLPYFLPAEDKVDFGTWVVGRTFIAGFGMVAGALFNLSIGAVIPETLSFLPMTLLILASVASCYVQFYGLLKLRTVK